MNNFIVLVVAVAMVIMVYYVTALAKKNIPNSTLEQIKEVATEVVYMIEQTMKGMTGEEKKAEAMKLAKEILNKLGIEVSDEILSVLIESAVFLMNSLIYDKVE